MSCLASAKVNSERVRVHAQMTSPISLVPRPRAPPGEGARVHVRMYAGRYVVSSPDPTLSRGETFLAGRRARAGHETRRYDGSEG